MNILEKVTNGYDVDARYVLFDRMVSRAPTAIKRCRATTPRSRQYRLQVYPRTICLCPRCLLACEDSTAQNEDQPSRDSIMIWATWNDGVGRIGRMS